MSIVATIVHVLLLAWLFEATVRHITHCREHTYPVRTQGQPLFHLCTSAAHGPCESLRTLYSSQKTAAIAHGSLQYKEFWDVWVPCPSAGPYPIPCPSSVSVQCRGPVPVPDPGHADHIWWSYRMLIYDPHIWSACVIIIYDHYTGSSRMMSMYGHHIWSL